VSLIVTPHTTSLDIKALGDFMSLSRTVIVIGCMGVRNTCVDVSVTSYIPSSHNALKDFLLVLMD
jgi:hypothetical protein